MGVGGESVLNPKGFVSVLILVLIFVSLFFLRCRIVRRVCRCIGRMPVRGCLGRRCRLCHARSGGRLVCRVHVCTSGRQVCRVVVVPCFFCRSGCLGGVALGGYRCRASLGLTPSLRSVVCTDVCVTLLPALCCMVCFILCVCGQCRSRARTSPVPTPSDCRSVRTSPSPNVFVQGHCTPV